MAGNIVSVVLIEDLLTQADPSLDQSEGGRLSDLSAALTPAIETVVQAYRVVSQNLVTEAAFRLFLAGIASADS
ncbi:hypothetical protein [Bordetella bronchiseptica]|uniref:hypothetical protein n=1 Tax=Bordetella bronchiseptica TaxID=518 RepID=UPI0011D21D68|nr:hypothetical protein [Bordetella bronchiseptica]